MLRRPLGLTWRLKLMAARARRRRAGPSRDREEVVRAHAPGRSFCDVGCMWNVHGRIAFVAEEAGATRVTGIDVMAATEQFRSEHERRSSQVRFVERDLHAPGIAEDIGTHQVVWCSGVLYHSPSPVLTLARLRELTSEVLILQTMTVPDLPGVGQGMVFLPGLPARQRRLYELWGSTAAEGLREPAGPADYGPWWWGISPSALRAMLRSARFEPVEEWGDPFGRYVRARPV